MLGEFWQSIKVLLENRVVRNISLATIGTAVSQGILVAVLPLLTRLYEPSDFALLAIYTSMMGLLVVIASGRYNLAISLPKDDADGLSLLIISLIVASAYTALLTLLYWFFGRELLSFFSLMVFTSYSWLVPLGVFFAAYNMSLEYWFARTKQFQFLAKTRIFRAVVAVTFQIIIGALAGWPAGLILGQLAFVATGTVIQISALVSNRSHSVSRYSVADLKRLMAKYSRFPLMSAPEATFNNIGVHVPILIIAAAAGPEAGFLMIAMRILAVPISLLGVSVQQVYLSEAPQKHRAGNLRGFTLKLQLALFRLGLLPLVIVGGLAPFLAESVFGAGWGPVGLVVLWMTPSYILQFIVSPVSVVLHITNNTGYAALLQLWGAILRVGSVACAAVLWPAYMIEVYAVSGFLFYSSYAIAVSRTLKVAAGPPG
jgi:O-antigen/teichoic acid export membrane protein